MFSKTHLLCHLPGPAPLRRVFRAAFFAIAAGFAAYGTSVARAADEPVTLNFVNADIEAVVKAVAEITGRNFVVDPRVKGTINIISARPVPAQSRLPDASLGAAAAGIRRRRG